MMALTIPNIDLRMPSKDSKDDDLARIEKLLDALQADGLTEHSRDGLELFGHAFSTTSMTASSVGGAGAEPIGAARQFCEALGLRADGSSNIDLEAWESLLNRLCDEDSDKDAFLGPLQGQSRSAVLRDRGESKARFDRVAGTGNRNAIDLLLSDLDEVIDDRHGCDMSLYDHAGATGLDCHARLKLDLRQLQHLRGQDVSLEGGCPGSCDALLRSARALLSARSDLESSPSETGICCNEPMAVRLSPRAAWVTALAGPPQSMAYAPYGQQCEWNSDARSYASVSTCSFESAAPSARRYAADSCVAAASDIMSGNVHSLDAAPPPGAAEVQAFVSRLGELEEQGDQEAVKEFMRKFLLGVKRRFIAPTPFRTVPGGGAQPEYSDEEESEDDARTVEGADTDRSDWTCRSIES